MSSLDKVWLSAFQVGSPEFVAETAIADVWKVKQSNGQDAALKIYKNGSMGNEAFGLTFMQALNGGAVVDVLATQANGVLLEWLPGPSLGDIVRAGNDDLAAKELVRVAVRLHKQVSQTSSSEFGTLPSLDDWFEDLFTASFHEDCPSEARHNVKRCQDLARKLLKTQTDVRPLHGDLHHDNVMQTQNGCSIFDAKGVIGDRAYELANAFRNPIGAGELVRDRDRVLRMLDLWSSEFAIDRIRLMQWATVKAAISIRWRSGPIIKNDKEFHVLALFLETLDGLPK